MRDSSAADSFDPSSNEAPGRRSVGTSSTLAEKIDAKTARIGVLGLGYVGLPLAVAYAAQGFDCVGFDVDQGRVDRLNAGQNDIQDVDDERFQAVLEDGRFRATSDPEVAPSVDVFFICVPTPINEHKEPDPSYIESAARMIGEHLRPGQLVVLKSTTYPETTERLVQPILETAAAPRNLTLGEDYFLGFSPERLDPGNKTYTTENVPVVVGGVTEACTEHIRRVLEQVVGDVHTVSSPKVAEMEKLLENIFRSVNIALVNELAQLCERMDDVSIWEVVEAAATKPFGFMPFYPGPGLGGHCIPVDPHYLSWLAQRYDFETSFITLSARVNEAMPHHVCQSVVEAIAEQPISLGDATVLILGVAFKADVSDTRHSPAERIVRLLHEKGVGRLQYHDPHVPSYAVQTASGDPIECPAVELTPETLRDCDVAVIVTGHDALDADLIAEHAPRIVDARNLLGSVENGEHLDKIELLGRG